MQRYKVQFRRYEVRKGSETSAWHHFTAIDFAGAFQEAQTLLQGMRATGDEWAYSIISLTADTQGSNFYGKVHDDHFFTSHEVAA